MVWATGTKDDKPDEALQVGSQQREIEKDCPEGFTVPIKVQHLRAIIEQQDG